MSDDRELIKKVSKGDLRAFEALVKQYENLVYYVTRRLVKKQEDVEDICQEVFIKVHKNLSSFKFQSKLSTWIAQVAYNTSINYLKKNKKEQQTQYSENTENVYYTTEDPEQIMIKLDVSTYLDKLIGQLPEQYSTVLTLYHLKEFSYQEIETITGMPEGTVKSYLFRARKMLKDKLEKYLKNQAQ
jgi:RNA polymerase sigma factor (sigma-70 family)